MIVRRVPSCLVNRFLLDPQKYTKVCKANTSSMSESLYWLLLQAANYSSPFKFIK